MRDAFGDSNRTLATAATAATLCAIAVVGQSLFFGPYVLMTLAPLAGLLGALALRDRVRASVAALAGVLGGAFVASLVASPAWSPLGTWLPTVALAAVIAAVVGFAAAMALDASDRIAPLLAGVCVVIVIGAAAATVLDRANVPLPSGLRLVDIIAPTSDSVRITSDETIYALLVRSFREGRPYYETLRDLLVRRNSDMAGWIDPRVAMSYRLPTLYALLAGLGATGESILAALLAVMAAAIASAYLLCRRFLSQPLAVLGAVSAAGLLAGYAGGIRLLDTEFWAGMLGLVAVTAFVWAGREGRSARLLLAGSLAVAVLAALIRELGIAFLIVGLLASLAPAPGSRWRRVVPWAIGLVGVVGVYFVHWRRAAAVIATLPPAAPVPPTWLQPFGIPLASAVWFEGVFMKLALPVAIVVAVLGVAGSVLGPSTWRDRAALGLVVLGGSVLSLFLGTFGDVGVGKLTPPYWSMMFMPTLLACLPLVAAWRRKGLPAQPTHADE